MSTQAQSGGTLEPVHRGCGRLDDGDVHAGGGQPVPERGRLVHHSGAAQHDDVGLPDRTACVAAAARRSTVGEGP